MHCTILNNATACRLQTFRNHPWIFRDATTGLRLCTERSYSSWQEVSPVAIVAPSKESMMQPKHPVCIPGRSNCILQLNTMRALIRWNPLILHVVILLMRHAVGPDLKDTKEPIEGASQCERCVQVAYASDGIEPSWSTAFPGGMRILMIKEPPHVTWSREAHKAFPARFRAAAATLLMCHHVAGRQLSDPSEG